jgi:hypothetical protein
MAVLEVGNDLCAEEVGRIIAGRRDVNEQSQLLARDKNTRLSLVAMALPRVLSARLSCPRLRFSLTCSSILCNELCTQKGWPCLWDLAFGPRAPLLHREVLHESIRPSRPSGTLVCFHLREASCLLASSASSTGCRSYQISWFWVQFNFQTKDELFKRILRTAKEKLLDQEY